MKLRGVFVSLSRIAAATAVFACITAHAQAAHILISGNAFNSFDGNLTTTVLGLGNTALFAAPNIFDSISLTGFDAVWLDGFSQFGNGSWPSNLVTFMNGGGNVFIQNPGFGSESMATYPLGAGLAATFTNPPGENTVHIVDTVSPSDANHAVNAGLTDAGLSSWAPSAYGFFTSIGSFTGVTDNGTPGDWITIVTSVGSGHLVYTEQGVGQFFSANPGTGTDAARFFQNVITLAPAAAAPEPSTVAEVLLGLGGMASCLARRKARTTQA